MSNKKKNMSKKKEKTAERQEVRRAINSEATGVRARKGLGKLCIKENGKWL